MLSNCKNESKSETIESESDQSTNEIELDSCNPGNKPVEHGVKSEILKSSHILENAQHGCLASDISSTIRDIDKVSFLQKYLILKMCIHLNKYRLLRTAI